MTSLYLEFNTKADCIEKDYSILRKTFNDKIGSQNFVILMESEAGELPFFYPKSFLEVLLSFIVGFIVDIWVN